MNAISIKLIFVPLLMSSLLFSCKSSDSLYHDEYIKIGIDAIIKHENRDSIDYGINESKYLRSKKYYSTTFTDLSEDISGLMHMNRIECVKKINFNDFQIIPNKNNGIKMNESILIDLYSHDTTKDTVDIYFKSMDDLRKYYHDNPQQQFFYFSPLYYNPKLKQYFFYQGYRTLGIVGVLIDEETKVTEVIDYDCF